MDRKFYNLERREKEHNVRHLKQSPHRHVFRPKIPEDLPDRKMDESLRSYEVSTDLKKMLSQFEGVEKTIFRMYYLERKSQETIAKFLGNTQSYVSKHLQKIKKVVELSDLRRDDQNKREAYAEQQWEKFLDQCRTDGDEDILFDMFRCICGSDLQEAFLEWFYSYREYTKFCLQYLILHPFDHYADDELDRQLSALAEWQKLTFRLQFAEHIDEIQWLYIELCEKMNARQKELKTPPSSRADQRNFRRRSRTEIPQSGV